MALYIPAAQRRRRLVVAALASLAVGLLVGIAVGRLSAPKAADSAATAKTTAERVTGALVALPVHYEQASKGEIDKAAFKASLDAALQKGDADLATAMDDAPWLDPSVRVELRSRVAEVRALADRGAPPAEFEAAVNRAVKGIDAAFGNTTVS